jgi:hypothetical protein
MDIALSRVAIHQIDEWKNVVKPMLESANHAAAGVVTDPDAQLAVNPAAREVYLLCPLGYKFTTRAELEGVVLAGLESKDVLIVYLPRDVSYEEANAVAIGLTNIRAELAQKTRIRSVLMLPAGFTAESLSDDDLRTRYGLARIKPTVKSSIVDADGKPLTS